MSFIGRRSDVDRILALIHAPSDSALVVAGGHGVGKSALLEEIPRLSDYPTVFLRATAAENRWPLSGVTALLDCVGVPACAGGSAGGKLLGDVTAPGDVPSVACMLLDQLHRRVSSRTVLVIDDADLLDEASQAVIGFLVRRMAGTNLAVIVSVSGSTPWGPFANLPLLQLLPMNHRETVRILEAVPVRAVSPAAMHAAAAAAQGNPLAALEIYSCLIQCHAGNEQALPVPLPKAQAFTSVHDAGLAALTPAARRTMDLLSLCCRTAAATLENLDPALVHGIDDAVASGMVLRTGEHLKIHDELLRAHVYAALPAESRASDHKLLAKAAEGTDPQGHRWHASFTGAGSTTPVRLLQAAAGLIKNGEVAFAVECMERALSLNPRAAHTAGWLATLADMLLLRGEFVFAARYLDWALRSAVEPGLVFRLQGLALQAEFLKGAAVRPGVVHRLVKESGHHDRAFAARLLISAALYYTERWEHEEAQQLLELVRLFQGAASPDLLAVLRRASAMTDSIRGNGGRPDDRPEGGGRTGLALLVEGRCLTYSGRHDLAAEAFAMVQNKARPPEAVWREAAQVLAVDNEIRAGRIRAAVALIEKLELDHPDNKSHSGMRHVFRMWRAQAVGNEALAKERVGEARHFASSQHHPALTAQIDAFEGHFALLRGNLAEALAHLSRAAEIGARFPNPALLGCESDLVEVLIRLGHHHEATQALFRLESRAVGLRSVRLMMAIARSRAMLADGDHSLQLFAQALAGKNPQEYLLEKARTTLCYAERLSAFGRIKEAREGFLRAKILFDEVGADAWTQHVDFLLLKERMEPAGDPAAPALLMLTDHERTLARMVARGMRNKEIAATLFISVRTVEVRLTAIYRKLGVESRAQLSALAAGGRATASEKYVLPVL